MEPLHWILSIIGAGGIATTFAVNASRKRDAKADREQRDQIAAEDRTDRKAIAADQLAVATRQADIAAQAVADAAADRKQQAAIEERRAKESDGTLKALTEIIRRTAPASPPAVAEDKPDTTASPNPAPGQDGAESKGAASAKGGNGQAAPVDLAHGDRGDCGSHTDRRVPPPDQPAGNLEDGPKDDDRRAG